MNSPMRGADAALVLRQLIMGFGMTQMVHVAAKLGLSDLLHDNPQPAHALAQAAGADPDALRRLPRALASVGIYSETGDGRFGLTPLSQALCSGSNG